MITSDAVERVRGWFTGRVPDEWQHAPLEVTVDREEITVLLTLRDVELPETVSPAEAEEARAGRARGFREDTRERRIGIAREAERRYERKVSWAVRVGPREERFTTVAAPVMTRLRQPQRQVLDTLVDAGVARSRSEALAWCVRLVAEHQDDWLGQLREAMSHVAEVRAQGPTG